MIDDGQGGAAGGGAEIQPIAQCSITPKPVFGEMGNFDVIKSTYLHLNSVGLSPHLEFHRFK